MERLEYGIEFVLFGDKKAGKTEILRRYIDDEFLENDHNLQLHDFKVKRIQFNQKDIKLFIWDVHNLTG